MGKTKASRKRCIEDILTGITETQAGRWWAQYYNDPSIHRDNSGYEGAEVLYICKGKVLNNRSEVYVDGHCETASKVIKGPNDRMF